MLRSRIKYLGWVFVLLGIDQLIKYLLKMVDWLDIVINQGIVFGINIDLSIFLYLFIITVIILWGFWADNKWGPTLIAGGGLSNIIDRLIWGGVVDFKFNYLAGFNLADAFIIIGVLIVIKQLID
jgi:lipoprotein signal peptidase